MRRCRHVAPSRDSRSSMTAFRQAPRSSLRRCDGVVSLRDIRIIVLGIQNQFLFHLGNSRVWLRDGRIMTPSQIVERTTPFLIRRTKGRRNSRDGGDDSTRLPLSFPPGPHGRAVRLAPEGKKAPPRTRHVRGSTRTRRHVQVSFSRHLSCFHNLYATLGSLPVCPWSPCFDDS